VSQPLLFVFLLCHGGCVPIKRFSHKGAAASLYSPFSQNRQITICCMIAPTRLQFGINVYLDTSFCRSSRSIKLHPTTLCNRDNVHHFWSSNNASIRLGNCGIHCRFYGIYALQNATDKNAASNIVTAPSF